MSKIGEKIITIPDNVQVSIKNNNVLVKSGENELNQDIHRLIKIEINKQELIVKRKNDSKQAKSLHGLTRSLIFNMIIGVTKGYEKILELHGTGYRAESKKDTIQISLGFSHPVMYKQPKGVKIEVKDKKTLIITGADKQIVGQTAAEIRHLRVPDVYKGKGIRYQGEVIKLKPGKAAKGLVGE